VGVNAPTEKAAVALQVGSAIEDTTTSIIPSGMNEGTVQSTVRCVESTDVLTVARSVVGEAWGYTFTFTEPVSNLVPTATHVMFSREPCSTLVAPLGSGASSASLPTEVAQYPG
jgi:hypothetical protein